MVSTELRTSGALAIAAYLPTYAPLTTPAQPSRLPRFEARSVLLSFQPGDPVALSSVVTNCDEVATHPEYVALLREAARRLNRFADDTDEAMQEDDWADTTVVLAQMPHAEPARTPAPTSPPSHVLVVPSEEALPHLEPTEQVAVTLTLATFDRILASLCEQIYDFATGDTGTTCYDVLAEQAADLATLAQAVQQGSFARVRSLLQDRSQTPQTPTR